MPSAAWFEEESMFATSFSALANQRALAAFAANESRLKESFG